MGERYTCAECKRTFETGWDEDEARREFEKMWPNSSMTNCDKLCIECYERLFSKICQ